MTEPQRIQQEIKHLQMDIAHIGKNIEIMSNQVKEKQLLVEKFKQMQK